jgi:hypothetical protein
MESSATNRLSQGFGLAAAVVSSDKKNMRNSMTPTNPLSNSSQVRSYIQMIEAEDTR